MSCCGAYNVMMVCFLWWCLPRGAYVGLHMVWGGGGVICPVYGSLYMHDLVYSDTWYV